MDIACCCTCYYGETDCHAERGAHKHFAATEDVMETCTGTSEYPACDGVNGVEEKLGVGVCYADIFDKEREVLE